MTSCWKLNVLEIFPIYGQIGATRKPDSGQIVCKTYIFVKSNLLSYKNWKQNEKIFNTALTLLLSVKVLFLPKMTIFLQRKMLISTKSRGPQSLTVWFLKLNMCVYLPPKFQVSSIILTSFIQGVVLILSHIFGNIFLMI